MFIKNQETKLQVERMLQKAGLTLGFTKHQAITPDLVRQRFTTLVKMFHPDSISDAEATRDLSLPDPMPTLNTMCEAKDYILKYMENTNQ